MRECWATKLLLHRQCHGLHAVCKTTTNLFIDGKALVRVDGHKDGSRVRVDFVSIEADAQVCVDAIDINV